MRTIRIVIGFVAPSLLGALLVINWTYVFERREELGATNIVFGVIVTYFTAVAYAFLLIGIQSLVCALLMEFLVAPRIRNIYLYLLVSCLLGALSGATVLMFIDRMYFIIIGVFVGLIVGLGLYRLSRDVPEIT